MGKRKEKHAEWEQDVVAVFNDVVKPSVVALHQDLRDYAGGVSKTVNHTIDAGASTTKALGKDAADAAGSLAAPIAIAGVAVLGYMFMK
jgi:hypothetical protein